MNRLRRAFVAIVPPPEVLDAVEVAVAPLRRVAPPRLSWTRRAHLHLTLRFLGAVDDTDVLTDSLVGNLHGRARACALGSVVAALGDRPVGPVWHAREVLLMESDTRPTEPSTARSPTSRSKKASKPADRSPACR